MLGDTRQFLTPEHAALALRPAVVAAVWAAVLVGSVARYLVWSGGLYWFFYRRQGRRAAALRARKIQPAAPGAGQLANELRWSLGSCLVYSFMTAGLYVCALKGWTRLYLSVADRGWPYAAVSFVLMLVLHDGYFYATHRLSHRVRWLFRRVHRIHHQSTNPTPFADIMFHPVDAVVHAGFVPLFLFLLPLHPGTLALFLTLVQVVNAIGHIGYEVFPEWQARHPLWRWVSRPTAHNLHHSRINCNFGLYFAVWDRLLGTEWTGPASPATDAAAPAAAGDGVASERPPAAAG